MPCPTYPQNFRKIRHNFLSYPANRQTDRQTKTGKNITSLAEVIISPHFNCVAIRTFVKCKRGLVFLAEHLLYHARSHRTHVRVVSLVGASGLRNIFQYCLVLSF